MFIVGVEYPRAALLTFVGSRQARSGVIWGPREPGCVICTSGGRHGHHAGYGDIRNEDGTWFYFGQGEEGDQSPTRAANRLLLDGKHTVLLFTTHDPTAADITIRGSHAKLYRFEDTFGVGAWDYHTPATGPRAGDRLLRLHLVPVEENCVRPATFDAAPDSAPMSLSDLRSIVLRRSGEPVTGTLPVSEYRRASHYTRVYVLRRAEGLCDNCREPAPFIGVHGEPFLEVHHIHRLADDGPDDPANVVALCPNCHRAAHFGQDRDAMRHQLALITGQKEKHAARRR